MRNILTIARREVTRLRTRFTGRSRLLLVAVLALMIIGSYVIYHQGMVVSKGLYTIGVSAGAPTIADKRFNVVELDRRTAQSMLKSGAIDLYIDGKNVIDTDSERSRVAAGAIKQYLGKLELLRIAQDYPTDAAFPLRIEICYADVAADSSEANSAPVQTINARLEENPPVPRIEIMPEPESVPGAGSQPQAPAALSQPQAPAAGPEPAALPLASSTMPGSAIKTGTDNDVVLKQLQDFSHGSILPEFKADFVSENEIIIPSLMTPPIPLAQVLITFLYIIPVFFVSIFFTSSFAEEKINRKLTILLSTPVTRFQLIIGKMLPYLIYAVLVIIAVTIVLHGNLLLSLAIFIPVMLFIFAIYLIVALTYRTFKDQTFFSVLALSAVTVYLISPAMFVGVSDLSYISPLTLAIQMYRGQSFGITHYFMSTGPLFIVFGQTLFIGTRCFNEEYLMGYKPLHAKVAEALYLVLDKKHLNFSVLFLSLFLVPVVFLVQLVSIVLVSNLYMPVSLWLLMIISVVIEEIAKSMGIFVLWQNRAIGTLKDIIILSVLSAVGFLLGEKLLLFLSLRVLTPSVYFSALSGAGLLVVPLVLHILSTTIVCLLTARRGTRFYPLAIGAGAVIHLIYDLLVMGAMR